MHLVRDQELTLSRRACNYGRVGKGPVGTQRPCMFVLGKVVEVMKGGQRWVWLLPW